MIWATTAIGAVVVASIYAPGDSGFDYNSMGHHNNPAALTCAHRSLPFGTRLVLHHGSNSVEVVINDRGPFKAGRTLDCMPAVNKALHLDGLGRVRVEFYPPLPKQRPEQAK